MKTDIQTNIRFATILLSATLTAACGDARDPALDDAQPGPAAAGERSDGRRFVPHEAIVKFREEPDGSGPRTLGGHRISLVQWLGPRTYLVRFEALAARRAGGAATLAAVSALANEADEVESAVENQLVQLSAVPTDPLYNPHQRWNYEAVRLPQAWDLTTGVPGVRIAVLDTGRVAHPDLVWGPGYDAVAQDSDPTTEHNYHHGAHVAGILGARPYNGLGGVGVCWGCTLVPVRISAEESPSIAAVAAGILWVSGWNGLPIPGERHAEVINLSMNEDLPCTLPQFAVVRDAIADAAARGIPVVVSAGNFGKPQAAFPADCPGAIAVAASQPNGTLAPYTNRGAHVDLTAPGGGLNNETSHHKHFGADVGTPVCPKTGPANTNNDPYQGTAGVVSSWSVYLPGRQLTYWDHCYRHLSGTSMAAPHVSGTIGLMLSANPSLSTAMVERYLTDTASPMAVFGPEPNAGGAGLLDARAAVEAAFFGRPDIELSPASLAFPITRIYTVSEPIGITVRNVLTGTLNATVRSPHPTLFLSCASGSCTCPTAAECQVSVGAGQQAIVNATYGNYNITGLSTTVTVSSNDPNESFLGLPATAATFSDALTSPRVFTFRNIDIGTTSYAENVLLINHGTAPLVISSLSATADTAHFTWTHTFTLPATVPAGGSVPVAVRCVPTSPGRKTMRLNFVTNATFPSPPVEARCDATAPDARVTFGYPAPDFGPQSAGTSTTSDVRVYNISSGNNTLTFNLTRPAAPFSLSCVSDCTCTATACAGSVSSGGNSARLELSYAPTNAGAHVGGLSFTSNAPNLPSQTFTITGTGTVP